MANESKLRRAALLLVAILFAAGLAQLYFLRFESGDVYPPYSTLRSDPLGVRVLYESLASLPEISAVRNLNPLTQLGAGRNRSLIVCGANLSKDPRKQIALLETFAAEGGRLVVAFYPQTSEPFDRTLKRKHEKQKGIDGESDEQDDDSKEDPDAPSWMRHVSLEECWGFKYAFGALPEDEHDRPAKIEALLENRASGLPARVPWHSALYFDEPAEAWRPIYSWDGHAVMMEREWGQGSIVLLSDSYLFSNEAMSLDRKPRLLAWLVGHASEIVFDETHLGLQENISFVGLARAYRLDGFIVALLVVAALFVWKNASSLAPKREATDPDDAGQRSERDATAGLVNLLRRSVPVNTVLRVCVNEWRRDAKGTSSISPRQETLMLDIVRQQEMTPSGRRDPVAAYRSICALVTAHSPRTWRTREKEPMHERGSRIL